MKTYDAKIGKQLELCKRNNITLQNQSSQLLIEKQQVVAQLQSLFIVYNKQKKDMEELRSKNDNNDIIQKFNNEQLALLKEENIQLKRDYERKLDDAKAKYNSELNDAQQKIESLNKKLSYIEDEKHRLVLSESTLKEQLSIKKRRLNQIEYSLDSKQSKLEHEIVILEDRKSVV